MGNKHLSGKNFKDISPEEIGRYHTFIENHQKKTVEYNSRSLEYYCCGKGQQTILLPPGGMAILPPEFGFRSITYFEKNFRVIAPDIKEVTTIEDLCQQINYILDHERVEKASVIGGSGAGIFAQVYFKYHHTRVEKMVLFNTLAPRLERNKKSALVILHLLPSPLLKYLFQKKAKKLLKAEVPEDAQSRVHFYGALLNHMVGLHFNKKRFYSILKLAQAFNQIGYRLTEFNSWSGRTFIISCEDDPGFKDTEWLMNNLPNTDKYIFPKGLGHLAHIIHMDKFFKLIDDFLR